MWIAILCNLIWSFHSVIGKSLLLRFSPLELAVARYGLAFLTTALIVGGFHCLKNQKSLKMSARQHFLAGLMGFGSFCFAPLLHLKGLQTSQAIESSFIVAIEPFTILILGALVLKERIHLRQALELGTAFLGFCFLSKVFNGEFSPWALLGSGQILILISMFGEGSHTVMGRKLSAEPAPPTFYHVAFWSQFWGVLFLVLLGPFWMPHDFSGGFLSHFASEMASLTLRETLSLLWIGPLGTGVGYFLWVVALQKTEVAVMVLTLFIQPLFGAVLGWILLGERLSVLQFFGAFLILTAVALQSFSEQKTNFEKSS